MLEPNSIVKSVTSFLRLCLHNSKESLDKCFLSTLWGPRQGKHRTLYLDLHHRHASSVLLHRVICLGHMLVLSLRLSLAFTTQGVLCDFTWSFLPVFHSCLKGTHSHLNSVVDFIIFAFPTYRDV